MKMATTTELPIYTQSQTHFRLSSLRCYLPVVQVDPVNSFQINPL